MADMNGADKGNHNHPGQGAHLTFTDCQYSVETTMEGKPVPAFGKMCGKPTKTRYLLRERLPPGPAQPWLLARLAAAVHAAAPRGPGPKPGRPALHAAAARHCASLTRPASRARSHPTGGISGEVTHGSVLAIMGPSGAGKTTLLNMLTLEKKGGLPRGKIEINGQPFTRALYNKHCAYVQQEDSLWATFSSRDHLRYAFDLCQPHLTRAEREAKIDKLIDAVGLTQAQHIKAGNAFIRGLSSGLKRRLSIAIALAKQPSVLFLDEPTSGIDSASAASMMTFLKQM